MSAAEKTSEDFVQMIVGLIKENDKEEAKNNQKKFQPQTTKQSRSKEKPKEIFKKPAQIVKENL